MKEWRVQNKEHVAQYNRAYAKQNPRPKRLATVEDKITSKLWRERNEDAIREYNRIYTIERYNSDPLFRLKLTERTRINQGLRGKRKAGPSTHLLGCSWAEFKAFIERQFRDGMSWDNMGEWHVDHIRPLASFDLGDPIQQKIAFHFTNHQPLWALDNLKKGAKHELRVA